MNIKLADRLVELRKEHKLSQEALAEKLGLSRQAISKWERAEASPDTDNLIALSELYGITLDQLLGNQETKENKNDGPKKEKKPLNSVQIKGKKLFLALPFVVIGTIVLYLLGGFVLGGIWWGRAWLLFFAIPICATVATALRAGKTERLCAMLMTIPVSLGIVMIYIAFGVLFGAWAKMSIIFLGIPLYAYIAFLRTKKK